MDFVIFIITIQFLVLHFSYIKTQRHERERERDVLLEDSDVFALLHVDVTQEAVCGERSQYICIDSLSTSSSSMVGVAVVRETGIDQQQQQQHQ